MNRRATWTTIALGAIVVIGWLDYLTGPEVGFSLFYLLPIMATGWWLGRIPVSLTVVLASLTWFVADIWSRGESHLLISAWNAVTRLGIYAAVGFLIAKVRADGESLRVMADREARLARTDSLTGLPNARALFEAADRELARARRSGGTMYVAYFDLDDFKRINDRYGHDEGDQLLKRVAHAIRQTMRATDLAARLGGDEFVVLFWNIDEASARQVCNRIVAQVVEIGSDYHEPGFGISAGVVSFARPPADAHELLRQADAAMYEVKRARRRGDGAAPKDQRRPSA
ncbi:MAG TPA: GGDEF domain-containing protein [Planctomycetota bacterium]|nr:GGDEF domain-containing protein [Planctomycetota bacterium]